MTIRSHVKSFCELEDNLSLEALLVLPQAARLEGGDRYWSFCKLLQQEKPRLRGFFRALFRTRTGDPLLTMEVLYQLS